MQHNQSSNVGERAPVNRRSRPKKALTNHRRRNSKRSSSNSKSITLQPIKVKQSGIMSAWKKSLGGLIRYYVHKRTTTTQDVDQKSAEEEIDQMYYRSGCGVEETKIAILKSLGVNVDVEEWVGVDMAIVKDSVTGNEMNKAEYSETVDKKGLILKQIVRGGEGPAHTSERWNTIVVPQWAIGKSYYFQVKNNTPLDFSCELFLDGEKVAFNAPLSANSTRTIRPDGARYYQRHEWILNDAKRVKLGAVQDGDTDTLMEGDSTEQQPVAPRYNGIRPDYQGKHISIQDYPDPTEYGWTFTGSVEASCVEFFEKKMNNGGLVKLDFYYTTGTIKTVLDHPTSGRNQLFRALVTPEQYKAVLENPRVHTDQGYRRSVDRPVGEANTGGLKEEDEFDKVPVEITQQDDANMEDSKGEGDEVSDTKFYARDVNYDFKVQGHQNRQAEMNKLQHDKSYVEWKEANKKEYAVIHAKFYVSTPKRMYRAPPNRGNGGRGNVKQFEPLPVPEQAPVVDVKAAEKCTLGTNYVPCAPQTIGRSNVRMERVNGLTDEKQWKGDPVFEKKLFYRAESIINGVKLDGMSGDEMSEDEENTQDVSAVELAEYKAEKVSQVEQYHLDLSHCVADEEEAEQLLRNAKNKIHLSASKYDVDECVNIFYQDLVHRQFLEAGTCPI
jgi:hypothetical protein